MMTMLRNILNGFFFIAMLSSGMMAFGWIMYTVEGGYVPEVSIDNCGKQVLNMSYKTGTELLLSYKKCVAKDDQINSIKDGAVYVWSLISTVGFGHKTVQTTWGRILTYSCLPWMILFKATESYFGQFIVTYIGDGKRLSHQGFWSILVIMLLVGLPHAFILWTFGDFDSFHSCIWFLFIASTTIGLGDEEPPIEPFLCYFTLLFVTIEIVLVSLLFGYNMLRVRQFVVSKLEYLQDCFCAPLCDNRLQRVRDDETLNPSYLALPNSLSTGHTLPADVNGPTNFAVSGMVPPGKLIEFEERIRDLFREYEVQEVKVEKDEPPKSRSISRIASASLSNLPGMGFLLGSTMRIPVVSITESTDSEEGNSAYSQEVMDTVTPLLDVRRTEGAPLQTLFDRPHSQPS